MAGITHISNSTIFVCYTPKMIRSFNFAKISYILTDIYGTKFTVRLKFHKGLVLKQFHPFPVPSRIKVHLNNFIYV